MASNDDSYAPDVTDGGAIGTHPRAAEFQVLAGPATGAERNLVRFPHTACWRVDDVRFEFGSSIVLPSVRAEMPMLAALIARHTKNGNQRGAPSLPPVLSLFGHADPVGEDEFNKALSGRRSAAIYGLLTRQVEVWEDLYTNGGAFAQPLPADRWQTRSIRIMLRSLGGASMAADGEAGPETRQAITEFQRQNGLPTDGVAGPATRKKLFRAFMDKICVDGSGQPF